MAQPETRTKVVVRKLPPFLKQEGFFDALKKGFEGAYDWSAYYPGKISHQRLVHSRAYVNFKKPETVFDFYEVFNGHVFVNEKGAQFRAEVEYAPYQKIPKGRNKKDLREGTIFEDPDYLAFLENLERPKASSATADAQKEEAEKAASKGPIITPLIEYIRQKRANKAAAGREKVGPRVSSRDAPRKAVPPAGPGTKAAKKSDKGILEHSGAGGEDAASRVSRTEWKSKGEPASAAESDKNAPSTRNFPRDGVGILKRPAAPQSETSSDRKREVTLQGGPDKRIVKGALASIIGGGLGRPPRGSRRDSEAERNVAPVDSSGWGEGAKAGPTKSEEGEKTGDASNRQNGRNGRRGADPRRGTPKRTESDSQPTGWDGESEGLLRGSQKQGQASSREEKPSFLGSGPQRVTILQRKSGGSEQVGTSDSNVTAESSNQTPRSRRRGQPSVGNRRPSDASPSNGADDGASPESDQKQHRRGRGQQATGNQTPRQGGEVPPHGAGRGSRQRGQGPTQSRTQESDSAAVAAKAAWDAISGAAPQNLTSSTPELTSAGATWQPRAPSGQPNMRTVQDFAGGNVNSTTRAAGNASGTKSGDLKDALSGSLESMSLQEGGRAQPRKPRHQGPYQPRIRRANEGASAASVGGVSETGAEAGKGGDMQGADAAKKRMWVAIQKPG